MIAMTCKLNDLFSIDEDFDEEDLLRTDWAACSASGPAAVSSCVSCVSCVSSVHSQSGKFSLQKTGERSAAPCDRSASRSSTHTAAGQTVAPGLRRLSSSSCPSSSSSSSTQPIAPPPPTVTNSRPNLASQQSPRPALPCFDDWDVDLADLEDCDRRVGPPPPPAPTTEPPSSARTLRPSTCGGIQTRPDRTLRATRNVPPRTFSAPHLQSPIPPLSPGVSLHCLAATSPASGLFTRTLTRPQQPQEPRATPRPSPQAGLFPTAFPVPCASSASSALSPHPLHTPVLTNRLVQLVSASNQLPKKRPRSEPHRPRTRRFPGPAGLLPQQPDGRNLDEIVVSAPQTPAHGVVARLPSQGSSSQTEEDEFGGGAWAAMKAEMGLDERNPSCFLHSYSVVMVLRKAALKQLAGNKVPNMAVLLKSIIHTHADAKALFKDPTGEIQGTVHRRLLEDREEELKVGAVLLLKQVGVFSPSHRNHYLNVTPNNLLRIYAPDGAVLSSARLPPLVLEDVLPSPARPRGVLREPVSRMQLVFDEEDEEGKDGGRCASDTRVSSSRGPQVHAGNPETQDPGWDADDDLDRLLGELPDSHWISSGSKLPHWNRFRLILRLLSAAHISSSEEEDGG
ncbi:homologous recombination OB-fold protein isoform X2 [Brachyistius frenatus]|uniref:homologous recombination OB-fold protein isoform X2 n=1 Tax=Brachyistius frenatus TaxID=100188 RepID=UPI0037E81F37